MSASTTRVRTVFVDTNLRRVDRKTVVWLTCPRKQGVMWIVLALWAALAVACGQARLPVRPQPPGHDFLIIGHRGAPHQACENTLVSFETALQLGANALELDVSMSSDRKLVLWHDWVPDITNELRPTGMCRLLSTVLRG